MVNSNLVRSPVTQQAAMACKLINTSSRIKRLNSQSAESSSRAGLS